MKTRTLVAFRFIEQKGRRQRESRTGPQEQPLDNPNCEYKEVTISLNVREGMSDRESRKKVDRIIAEHLEVERRQGWEPNESVDVSSLRTRNRIQFRFRWFQGPIYVAVFIRLMRPTLGD
jgi:hypothetical protein